MSSWLRGTVGVLLAIAALAVAVGARAAASAPPGGHTSGLCGSRTGRPSRFAHVVWIVMENHGNRELIGPPGSSQDVHAPYINRTLVGGCGWASNYHNVIHASLPNYIALTSGGLRGITKDCNRCSTSAHSVFRSVRRAGKSWRAYEEGMPRRCDGHDEQATLYVKRHNPPAYFTGLRRRCKRWDRPLGTLTQGALHNAIVHDRLPSFAFVTPDLCHDMHDCGRPFGDAWLQAWIPFLTSAPSYRAGRTVIFLTWDEGKGGIGGDRCPSNTSDPSCTLPLIVISPYTAPGTVSGRRYSHYSLLKTTERLLGLPGLLGHARDPSTRGVRKAFHL